MKHGRPIETGTKNPASTRLSFDVLPPAQAGLSAALRRAYAVPADSGSCPFDELIKQLG